MDNVEARVERVGQCLPKNNGFSGLVKCHQPGDAETAAKMLYLDFGFGFRGSIHRVPFQNFVGGWIEYNGDIVPLLRQSGGEPLHVQPIRIGAIGRIEGGANADSEVSRVGQRGLLCCVTTDQISPNTSRM